MPEPPTVYVEEVGRGPPPVEGVPTDVAAFLGATGQGPTAPTAVASFAEYQQLFGGAPSDPGYMAAAVAGFFDNGGRRAVVGRIIAAGPRPLTAADFEGVAGPAAGDDGAQTSGLAALALPQYADVALVYAPDAQSVPGLVSSLIAHCEQVRYRFAVIDSAAGAAAPTAPADSPFAACYHPWIQIEDGTGGARLVPPGGHVLGVYARVDSARGVFKAPANEQIEGAIGVAEGVNDQQQTILNAAGVNVIRAFTGRGIRVWGARTLSLDPQWRYVSVRRFLIYLEHSIDVGTQWVVFEPNGEALWARVQDAISRFLTAQWRAGALMGVKADEAFFVRCDRTTMTEDDIDNGRLICLVGVAPVRPAEFVIFRIGQWTADRA